MDEDRLDRLILASTRVHSAASLDDLLDMATGEARSLFAADAVVLTLVDPAGEYDVKSISPRMPCPTPPSRRFGCRFSVASTAASIY